MRIPDIRLETERLLLQVPRPEDLEPWAAMLADEETARFIGGRQERPGAWRNLALMIGCWAMNGHGVFSVFERATGRWIGRIGPWMPEGWPGPEIAWALHPSARGQGYATEAAARCIGWAREALGWTQAIHLIHPDNAASRAVAQRLGARLLRHVEIAMAPGVQVEVHGQDLAGWRS